MKLYLNSYARCKGYALAWAVGLIIKIRHLLLSPFALHQRLDSSVIMGGIKEPIMGNMHTHCHTWEGNTSMTNETHIYTLTNLDLFREKVATACRRTGRLQRELAEALGINAKVLSRKMHGMKQAFLTHAEVKKIIRTLANWDAITTQVEAIELLSLMGLRAENFSDQEWN